MRRLVWCGCLVFFPLLSCGKAPNDLWGSIDESFPLDFDTVEIKRQDLALIVQYIKDIHGGKDKVCKVVVDTKNLEIKDNSDLSDQAFKDETVTVQRVAATGGDFPPVTGGNMHFERYKFIEGGRIDGDFTVLFENGRNLFGNFDGKVEEISTE